MTAEARRVLEAVAWSERTNPSLSLPLKRIATVALGNADQAARVLADLDEEGYVRTDTMGWYSGWLTWKGRSVAAEIVAHS